MRSARAFQKPSLRRKWREQVLLAAASGAGMALLPQCVAERYAAPGARFVELAAPRPTITTGVVTRRDDAHGPPAGCDAKPVLWTTPHQSTR